MYLNKLKNFSQIHKRINDIEPKPIFFMVCYLYLLLCLCSLPFFISCSVPAPYLYLLLPPLLSTFSPAPYLYLLLRPWFLSPELVAGEGKYT